MAVDFDFNSTFCYKFLLSWWLSYLNEWLGDEVDDVICELMKGEWVRPWVRVAMLSRHFVSRWVTLRMRVSVNEAWEDGFIGNNIIKQMSEQLIEALSQSLIELMDESVKYTMSSLPNVWVSGRADESEWQR